MISVGQPLPSSFRHGARGGLRDVPSCDLMLLNSNCSQKAEIKTLYPTASGASRQTIAGNVEHHALARRARYRAQPRDDRAVIADVGAQQGDKASVRHNDCAAVRHRAPLAPEIAYRPAMKSASLMSNVEATSPLTFTCAPSS
jgi:hypothetical protein